MRRERNFLFFALDEEKKRRRKPLSRVPLDEFFFSLSILLRCFYSHHESSRSSCSYFVRITSSGSIQQKDDAACDDVHCEDASSTPRW